MLPLIYGLPRRSLVVPICGGLGGQIFGYTLFLYLRSLSKDRKVYADSLSLINSSGYRLASANQGLNSYQWDLGYYGITLHNNDIVPVYKHKVFNRLQGILRSTIAEGTPYRSFLYNNIKHMMTSGLFPVSREHSSLIADKYGEAKICIVHIRQSDYLNVSSQVFTAESSIGLIRNVQALTNCKVIYVSDGVINIDKIEKQLGFSISLEISEDYLYIHALMRRADILIGANSQFSLSASILAGARQLSFFPRQFFGQEYISQNSHYRSGFMYHCQP